MQLGCLHRIFNLPTPPRVGWVNLTSESGFKSSTLESLQATRLRWLWSCTQSCSTCHWWNVSDDVQSRQQPPYCCDPLQFPPTPWEIRNLLTPTHLMRFPEIFNVDIYFIPFILFLSSSTSVYMHVPFSYFLHLWVGISSLNLHNVIRKGQTNLTT